MATHFKEQLAQFQFSHQSLQKMLSFPLTHCLRAWFLLLKYKMSFFLIAWFLRWIKSETREHDLKKVFSTKLWLLFNLSLIKLRLWGSLDSHGYIKSTNTNNVCPFMPLLGKLELLQGGKGSEGRASYKTCLVKEQPVTVLQIKVRASNLFRQSLSLSLSLLQDRVLFMTLNLSVVRSRSLLINVNVF